MARTSNRPRGKEHRRPSNNGRKAKAAGPVRKTASAAPAEPPHPRPMLRRARWVGLDGRWDFVLDREARLDRPAAVTWEPEAVGGSILVPFAPETPASNAGGPGKGVDGFIKRCWYRRRFAPPSLGARDRLILHFGAVDYVARVWVNGRLAVAHEGGYTPFDVDVSDLLAPGGEQEVIVCADDDPHDLCKPRGKQDWLEQAHSIWYPRTTGIWQTVWLEVRPATHVAHLLWTPDLEAGEVRLSARIDGPAVGGARLAVTLRFRDRVLCDDVVSVGPGGLVRRSFPVAPRAAEDFAIDLLWSPEHPNLIDAELRLLGPGGEELDRVASYTALRQVAVDGDRFLLNRRPRTLRLVLNQGYWPETGLTAPDDEAFRRDVELIKQLGFDGVRMHQKVESPRFLYWADRLGLFVWGEMPSAYRYEPLTAQRAAREWAEVVTRDAGHPCVIAWVPVNESWGAPDLPTSGQQRAFVTAMYHLTRSLDPTRPVIGNDGWEIEASDITAIHDYDADPARIARRYAVATEEDLIAMLKRERPGYRRLVLDDYAPHDRPVMLTEFGGIAYSDRAGDWGYSRARSADDFARRYSELMSAVRSVQKFAGYCYTQFTDTYQEANGLLYMDRTPKADLETLRAALFR